MSALVITACGSGGGSDEPGSGNQAPSANAGIDQSVDELNVVNLNGAGSDPDGQIASYSWQQLSGTAVVINNASSANASFTAPDISSVENLSFRLVVADNDGANDSDDVVVTVNPVASSNQAPVANAGMDQAVAEGNIVNLTGSGADSDGSIVAYQWQQISGVVVALSNASTANASFTAPDVTAAEDLQFQLSVTDNDGASGNDDITVTVNACTAPDPSIHNMARANSYDNAWEAAWVTKVKSILATPVAGITKTAGKVLQVGDSMSYSYAYGAWARSAVGATGDDVDGIMWMHADVFDPTNGWEWSSNGTTAQNNAGWWDGILDNVYTDSQLNDAQFAVVMFNVPTLNPNDLSIVQQRANELIDVGIVPILSTIPPRTDDTYNQQLTYPYNAALLQLAQQMGLPIIDFAEEILLRRPNDTWANTLISNDGVHPSGGVNGYNADSNPYLPGGDPTAHITGTATLNSGYLLRTWLTVQKIKEIKKYAVDSQPLPTFCN